MIKLEDLKQGDVLTIAKDPTRTPHELIVIERSRMSRGKVLCYGSSYRSETKEYINDYCTSWTRDGVELLKQEQEEFVFCPIYKEHHDFYVKINFDGCEGDPALYDLNLTESFGDYTFIGYSRDTNYPSYAMPSPSYLADENKWKVFTYAVFMLTSKLEVGGE